MREINQAGLGIIEKRESLQLKAYICPRGKLTIGYGHTGPDVHLGMVITKERAEELLQQDLRNAESAVSRLVKITLSDDEYSALVSFVFNIGGGEFEHDCHLLTYLNQGRKDLAEAEFPKWDHCNGKVLGGLTERRADELALFLGKPISE